jgi:hypothetical protein
VVDKLFHADGEVHDEVMSIFAILQTLLKISHEVKQLVEIHVFSNTDYPAVAWGYITRRADGGTT